MATSPYDSLTTVLNAARTRLNDDVDSLLPLGGQLLSNTQAFTQQMANTAWRKLQDRLVSMGYVRFQSDAVILSVGALTSIDPALQVYLSWTGYFDGVTLHDTPVLPADLIAPIEAWERESGTQDIFTDMDLIATSIPTLPKLDWQGMWQWQADRLYMPGARVDTDIRVSYAAYLVDFIDTGDVTSATDFTPWFDQPVPIIRSLDSLSGYICAEVEKARGNMSAAVAYTAEAEDAAQMITDKDFMRQKGVSKVSEFGKMRDGFTPKDQ